MTKYIFKTLNYELVYCQIKKIPTVSENIVIEAIAGRLLLISGLVNRSVCITNKSYTITCKMIDSKIIISAYYCKEPKSVVKNNRIDITKFINGSQLYIGEGISNPHICTKTLGDDFIDFIHENIYDRVAGGVGVGFIENKPIIARGFLYLSIKQNRYDSSFMKLVHENRIVDYDVNKIRNVIDNQEIQNRYEYEVDS